MAHLILWLEPEFSSVVMAHQAISCGSSHLSLSTFNCKSPKCSAYRLRSASSSSLQSSCRVLSDSNWFLYCRIWNSTLSWLSISSINCFWDWASLIILTFFWSSDSSNSFWICSISCSCDAHNLLLSSISFCFSITKRSISARSCSAVPSSSPNWATRSLCAVPCLSICNWISPTIDSCASAFNCSSPLSVSIDDSSLVVFATSASKTTCSSSTFCLSSSADSGKPCAALYTISFFVFNSNSSTFVTSLALSSFASIKSLACFTPLGFSLVSNSDCDPLTLAAWMSSICSISWTHSMSLASKLACNCSICPVRSAVSIMDTPVIGTTEPVANWFLNTAIILTPCCRA